MAIKIGVAPASKNLNHPADRRRFCFMYRSIDAEMEIANPETFYDIAYITISADLARWAAYKSQWKEGKNPVVIFDFCDDLLSESTVKDFKRAIYYYLSGKTSNLEFSYKKIIMNMISNSDVLICGSEEQRRELSKIHQNVHVIRDYFGEDIRSLKTDHSLAKPGELHLLWEGLAHGNQSIFEKTRAILEKIKGFKVHLHVITDSMYCRFGSSHFCSPTVSVIDKIFAGSTVKTHVYDWNQATFAAIATRCDMAIIPLDNDPIKLRKPENKMLLLWSLGLPTITSHTESYSRVMKSVGLEYAVHSEEEFADSIAKLASEIELRNDFMKRARCYLEEHCSDSAILKTWIRAINFRGNFEITLKSL